MNINKKINSLQKIKQIPPNLACLYFISQLIISNQNVLNFIILFMSRVQSKSLPTANKTAPNGKFKQTQKMPLINQQYGSHDLAKSDLLWANDKSHFRRKLNEGIQMQKSTILSNARKSSSDNPQYMLSNSDFYRRDMYYSNKNDSSPKKVYFDVLNNPKQTVQGRNQNSYFTAVRQNSRVTSKDSTLRKTLTHLLSYRPQVTAKIGSTSTRDYTIPHPQLKVGSNIFIDTYSPF